MLGADWQIAGGEGRAVIGLCRSLASDGGGDDDGGDDDDDDDAHPALQVFPAFQVVVSPPSPAAWHFPADPPAGWVLQPLAMSSSVYVFKSV